MDSPQSLWTVGDIIGTVDGFDKFRLCLFGKLEKKWIIDFSSFFFPTKYCPYYSIISIQLVLGMVTISVDYRGDSSSHTGDEPPGSV